MISKLVMDHSGNVYAGREFGVIGIVAAFGIAKWDGSSWATLGSGMNGSVRALAADGLGHLFVGGDFSFAGTNVSPYIAQANIGLGISGGRFGLSAYSPLTGFRCIFSDASLGQPYHIQAYPAVAAGIWTDLTNFAYSGPTPINDPAAVSAPMRFYRAVSP